MNGFIWSPFNVLESILLLSKTMHEISILRLVRIPKTNKKLLV